MKNLVLKNKIILFFLVFQFTPVLSQDKIIINGDSWNYYDNGYLEESWMLHPENYNWKNGKTPIGYGDKKIITEISYGNYPDNKHLVKYFKKKITLLKNEYLAYEFRTLSDDGIVVYINGKELYRINMPNSTINSKTLAINTIAEKEEGVYKINIFEDIFFKVGENIITTSVHQAYPDSSDCIFSLELIGHRSIEMLSTVLKNKDKTNNALALKIKKLNSEFEYEKILNEKETLANSNFVLKMILGIISILFLSGLMGYYYLLENIRHKETENKTQLQNLKEIDLKNAKEMIILTSKLLQNKQYFKEIKADLKGIETTDKKTVNSIISEINNVLESDKEWKNLKKHFDAVFSGFYDKLLKLHANLSETELRHCTFIKLHLQTKEIARMLLIDPRSVQTTRYRIKKKMNLSEQIDLREYLLKI